MAEELTRKKFCVVAHPRCLEGNLVPNLEVHLSLVLEVEYVF